ncbi:dienelactone hydrolase family protein [Nocardia callitridis]|uniref:Dienelactone hydrolase family protein n=1 Tax=Nocardia callitridis TaxID=648753 RepID=A0ABP9L4X9_9NOCA
MTSPTAFDTLDIPTPAGAADAYFARPDDGAAHPGVLLFMDAFGLRPWLGELVRIIAAEGYSVLAPNLFYRSGRAPLLPLPDFSEPRSRDEFFAALRPIAAASITPENVIQDVDAYLAQLESSEFVATGPIATVGYCLGGGLALRTAGRLGDRIAAAASFHGGNLAEEDNPDSPHRTVDGSTAQLYIAHADQDQSMPPEQITRLEQTLDGAGIRYTSVVYAGAAHGFTQRDIPSYNEQAYERHLTDLLALFGRAFGNSPR